MFGFLKRKKYITRTAEIDKEFAVVLQLSPHVPSTICSLIHARTMEEAINKALRMYPGARFLSAQTYLRR